MSAEDYEGLRALDQAKKELRRRYAVPCPVCQNYLPKASPSLLLPQERCKIHGYVDPRQRVPRKEVDAIFSSFGLKRMRD